MDLTNKEFSKYLISIPKNTRNQVFCNIKNTEGRNFRNALKQIGAAVRVNLKRLTPNELKKYISNNSQSYKSKPRIKKYKSAFDQSLKSSESSYSTSEDPQSFFSNTDSSQSNQEENESCGSPQSLTTYSLPSSSSVELNQSHKDKKEENLSSPKHKPVLRSKIANDSKEKTNQKISTLDNVNKEENTLSSPVAHKSVLDSKKSDSKYQKSSSQDSINNIYKMNNPKLNTKDISTNKTYQTKADNKIEDKKKMDNKSENEKYKLTIIDLFGEDDATREINIPVHKQIDNCSQNDSNILKTAKKIFGDKNNIGDISKMRRKSICIDNEDRMFKRSQSKEDISMVRRKSIYQETESSEDDALKRRNRSKSREKEHASKSNDIKFARRKSVYRETESREEDALKIRSRSKSREKEVVVSKNNETKKERRKSVYQEIETNRSKSREKEVVASKKIDKNDALKRRSRSKSREKEIVASKKIENKDVRRKSISSQKLSSEDDAMKSRTRSKSREKEVVASKKIDKDVRRKSISAQKESSENDALKRRSRSKSREKEIVASKKIESKDVRRKSISSQKLSSEDDAMKSRSRSKSREKEVVASKKIDKDVRRKSISAQKESSENDAMKRRSRSKSREKEIVASKKIESKDVRRKSISSQKLSSEDDAMKSRPRSKSREKEVVASKKIDKDVRRKSISAQKESSENDALKRRSRSKSREKEIVASKKIESKDARRKSISSQKVSSEDDALKRRSRSKSRDKNVVASKSNETKQERRKSVYQEINKLKSREKEVIASKKIENIDIRRKSIGAQKESSEDDAIKTRSGFKSREREIHASKKIVTNKVKRRRIVEDSDSSEDDTLKRRSKLCDEEVVPSKSKEIKITSETKTKSRNEQDISCKTNDKSGRKRNNEAKVINRSQSLKEEATKNAVKNIKEVKTYAAINGKILKVKDSSSNRPDKTSIIKRRQSTCSKEVLTNSNKTEKPLLNRSKSTTNSPYQDKSIFVKALKLKNSSSCESGAAESSTILNRSTSVATTASNSPAYMSENSSCSKMSGVVTHDNSSNSSVSQDLTKVIKRNKSSNYKDKTSTSFSKDKISSSSTNKKEETKNVCPNTPKRSKSISESKETTQKTPNTEKVSANTPKRIKSFSEFKEPVEAYSENSSDASIIRRKSVNREENSMRNKSCIDDDDSSDTSSDMYLDTVKRNIFTSANTDKSPSCPTPKTPKKQTDYPTTSKKSPAVNKQNDCLTPKTPSAKKEKSCPITPKRTASVHKDNIEEELESIFKVSTPKRKKKEAEESAKMTTRSLSSCSLSIPQEKTKDPGRRKRSLSTSEQSTDEDSLSRCVISKRRKSQYDEILTPSKSNAYINYADLVEQMKSPIPTPPSEQPIDFVAPLSSSKTGFSKPHYTSEEKTKTADITYDSVIVIQENDHSPHKLIVRKKSKQEVEEFQKRIISRRHSFHFEEFVPKEEPVDSSEETEITPEANKPKESIKPKPIKSILKRRSSISSIFNREVDFNDNTIDLQIVDIDKMFPSESAEDVLTLEISSDNGSPVSDEPFTITIKKETDVKNSRVSTNSAVCVDDLEKDLEDKIGADMAKNKPELPLITQESDSSSADKLLQLLSTEQAVNSSKDFFVSLLYIYEHYYKMTDDVENQKLFGLTPDLTIKKDYFAKRLDSSLTKMYKSLINIKVNHFSLIIFFDQLMNLLQEEFKNYKEITEVVIIFFMQRIIWSLLDNFTSPSDEKSLFNHVTAYQSVEYLVAKYKHITKHITDLDKKINDCFNDFSKKNGSVSSSASIEVPKTNKEPKKASNKQKSTAKPSSKPKSTNPVKPKQNPSLPMIETSQPSTSKPNPTQKRRGRPPKKLIHPEAVKIVVKQPPKLSNINSDLSNILANIDKNKTYLTNSSLNSAGSSVTDQETVAPRVKRKSFTSYEVTFDSNSTKKKCNTNQLVEESIETVVRESNAVVPKVQPVEPNKGIQILDIVVTLPNESTNQNSQNPENNSNTQLTSEILQLLKLPQNKTPEVRKQRMITCEGTIEPVPQSNVQKKIDTNKSSQYLPSVPPIRRDSVQKVPVSQVQPNVNHQQVTPTVQPSHQKQTMNFPQNEPLNFLHYGFYQLQNDLPLTTGQSDKNPVGPASSSQNDAKENVRLVQPTNVNMASQDRNEHSSCSSNTIFSPICQVPQMVPPPVVPNNEQQNASAAPNRQVPQMVPPPMVPPPMVPPPMVPPPMVPPPMVPPPMVPPPMVPHPMVPPPMVPPPMVPPPMVPPPIVPNNLSIIIQNLPLLQSTIANYSQNASADQNRQVPQNVPTVDQNISSHQPINLKIVQNHQILQILPQVATNNVVPSNQSLQSSDENKAQNIYVVQSSQAMGPNGSGGAQSNAVVPVRHGLQSSNANMAQNVVPVSRAQSKDQNESHLSNNINMAQNIPNVQGLQAMGQNGCPRSQNNEIFSIIQTVQSSNANMAQNVPGAQGRAQSKGQNESPQIQALQLSNINTAQKVPVVHGRAQPTGQNASLHSQAHQPVIVNMAQNIPIVQGRAQSRGQNDAPYSQTHQAGNINITQNIPAVQGRAQPRGQNDVPYSQTHQAGNINMAQNVPAVQGRMQSRGQNDAPYSQTHQAGNINMAQNVLTAQGRAQSTGQNEALQTQAHQPGNVNMTQKVPAAQGRAQSRGQNEAPYSQTHQAGNINITQNIPAAQGQAQSRGQNETPYSQTYQVHNINMTQNVLVSPAQTRGQNESSNTQNNLVSFPVNQANASLPRVQNIPTRQNRNKLMTSNGSLMRNITVPVSQVQPNAPPITQKNVYLPPNTSVSENSYLNAPVPVHPNVHTRLQNSAVRQPLLGHSPQHNALVSYQQGTQMMNSTSAIYPPNQDVNYPYSNTPMYNQALANSYAINEPVYNNLEYTYKNMRQHEIAEHNYNYKRMMREYMVQGRNPPPSYQEHTERFRYHMQNQNFRIALPTIAYTNDGRQPQLVQPIPKRSQMVHQPQPASNRLRLIPDSLQSNPVAPNKRSTSQSINELQEMTNNYHVNPEKEPTKKLIRPTLAEIDRLQRELEAINRSCPMRTSQQTYDMNSVTVSEISERRPTKVTPQHTIKWRMKKSVLQNNPGESLPEQNRHDGSVIRYQPDAYNALRNISRDSGYLSPSDIALQNPEPGIFCNRCMGPSNLMCSGCHTYYCSNECQQLSWADHEKNCYTISETTE